MVGAAGPVLLVVVGALVALAAGAPAGPPLATAGQGALLVVGAVVGAAGARRAGR